MDAILGAGNPEFSFFAGTGDWAAVRDAVANVSGVLEVAVSRSLPFWELGSENASGPATVTGYGIDPSRPPHALSDMTVLDGTLDLARGEIGLSREAAESLGVGLGGRVWTNVTWWDDLLNRTVTREVNLTVGAILLVPPPEISGPYPVPFFGHVAVIHIQDVVWVHEQLGYPTGYISSQGEAWIDRPRFIDPYNIEGTQRNLARLQREIEIALGPYQSYVSDNVSGALSNYSTIIAVQRLQYLTLSVPVILLGTYLGAVGVDLGHAERRRELAVLRTRGAGRGQVILVLLLEAVFGGLLAAVLGLLAGIGLSRLLLNYVNLLGSSTSPRYDVLALSADTVLTVAVLSTVFMAVVSYRSAKRTADLPVVETLRYHAPGETKIHYRPTVDVLMVTLAVLTYGMILYSRSRPADFLIFFIGTLFVVMIPFAPILLIVGTTRLLTRSTGRVYEWTARVCKPFAKNLYPVISRNLGRNPRRSANVAVIIALGLAFGVFTLSSFGSQVDYQERLLKAAIGGDASVTAAPANDTRFLADLRAVAGVAEASHVKTVQGQVPYGYATIYALDPATYFAVTAPEPFYLEGLDVATAAAVLDTPGQVLVSTRYAREAFLAVGDRLTLWSFYSNETGSYSLQANVTVGGIVRALPGVDPYVYQLPAALYGSHANLAPLQPEDPFPYYSTSVYILDLDPGANASAVRDAAIGLGAYGVRIYEEEAALLTRSAGFQAILGFINMEIAFVAVILSAGLGLIMYAATVERDVEFAAIAARGSSGWQTAGLLVGEAASILIIGFVVGSGIGLLAAFLTLHIISGFIPGMEPLIPQRLVVPPDALLLLALAPAAMIFTVLLVSGRIARMDIARVLKLRGG